MVIAPAELASAIVLPSRLVSSELLAPPGVVIWKIWPGAPVSRLAVGVPADCSWTTLEAQPVPSYR